MAVTMDQLKARIALYEADLEDCRLDEDDERAGRVEERFKVDFIGGLFGTGTPFSEESADYAGDDYICALSDGTIIAYGPDYRGYISSGRKLLAIAADGSIEELGPS